MTEIVKLGEHQRRVLGVLAEGFNGDDCEWRAYYFRHVQKLTGLTLSQARRACRTLAGKGLAKCEHGLLTEDGEVAGSGYRCTEAGRAALQAGGDR